MRAPCKKRYALPTLTTLLIACVIQLCTGNFAYAKLDKDLTSGEIECIKMLDENTIDEVLSPPHPNDSRAVQFNRTLFMYCGAHAIIKEIDQAPHHTVHCTNPALLRLWFYTTQGADSVIALYKRYTTLGAEAKKLLYESSKFFHQIITEFRVKCGPSTLMPVEQSAGSLVFSG